MRRFLSLLCCSFILVSLSACGASDNKDTTTKTEGNQTKVEEKKEEKAPESPQQETKKEYGINDNIKIGDNEITLTSTSIDKDSNDNKLIKLVFKWKNGSKETASFADSFGFKAFQDGVEMDGIELIGIGEENPDNKNKEVRPDKEVGDNFRWFKLNSDKQIELEVYKAKGLMLEGEPTILKVDVPSK